MKVGDLVHWHDKRSLLGVIIQITDKTDAWDVQGVRVHWSNGVTMNHSATWIRSLETSENT